MNGKPHPVNDGAVTTATKVASLRRPQTYAEAPARIDVVETHMSWVFLTERHAYKLKKPVKLAFLDFSTLAARRRNAAEEVRLNRRLAPDVYLGVVPLTVDAGGNLRVDGPGEATDWLVKMRRLPAERMLDRLIRDDALDAEDVRRLAQRLAVFYAHATRVTIDGERYRASLEERVHTSREELSDRTFGLPAELLDRIHRAQRDLLQREAAAIAARAESGHIVEGHGDLRPEHVCLEHPPVVFDCLEFNREFRLVDPADELGSLGMECERLGAAFVGRELLAAYEATTGDRVAPWLLGLYKAQRACLRAKLAIWHVRELERSAWGPWQTRAIEYLHLARDYLI